MLGSKKKEEAFPVNEALLNVITPMGLEIKRNSLVIGENLGKVYGAVRYPQKVDMGWLSKITNIPSTIVSVGITPIDNGSLISAISKSIVQQRGAADSAKDPLTRQRAEKAAEDGEKIMQRIDQEGETVAMMSLTVMPIAQDEVNFTKVCLLNLKLLQLLEDMRLCALIPKLPDYFVYLGVALEKALYKPGFFFDLGHRGLGSADYVPHALARYAALLGDLAKRKIFVIAEVEILTLLIREQLAVKIKQH